MNFFNPLCFVKRRIVKKRNGGYTLIEAIAAFMLASGVVAAVTAYIFYSFRMSNKARVEGDAVANAQLAFNFIDKQMFDIDNVYVKSANHVIFRQTYIPDADTYDGTTASLRSKWGSFWYKLNDDKGKEIKTLHFLESDEVAYHEKSGLNWSKRFAFLEIDDVQFTYSAKKMVITITYTKNNHDETRSIIFFYPRAQDPSDVLAGTDEPVWDPTD